LGAPNKPICVLPIDDGEDLAATPIGGYLRCPRQGRITERQKMTDRNSPVCESVDCLWHQAARRLPKPQFRAPPKRAFVAKVHHVWHRMSGREISGLDIPRPGACAESAPPAVEVARW
jgi:hypothetical protein